MSADAGEPQAISRRSMSTPPPAWSLPVAWAGALLFVVSLSFFVYAYVVRFGRVVAGDLRMRPIIVDVILFTVFAAHHSIFARSGAKAWLRSIVHPSLERSVYTWLASLLLIAVCALWAFVPGVAYRIPAPWSWIGYATQLCGVVLSVRGSKVLDVLDLAGVRPILAARSPRPTTDVALMTTGVYGLVRHPLYLGWALFVFGAPHMTSTRLVFAIVSTLYLAVAIPWEERGLIREFGVRYEDYRRRVRWRMIPGVY